MPPKTTSCRLTRFFKVYLQNSIAEYIWQFFIKNRGPEPDKAEEALKLLCLVLEVNPRYIHENMENFRQALLFIIKSEPETLNWGIVAQLARACQFLNDFKLVHSPSVDGLRNLFLKALLQLVFKHQGTSAHHYSTALEKIIHLCFIYRKNPESICEFIIKTMAVFLSEDDDIESNET